MHFLDCAKVFLITLNGLFALLGLAMLGVGGYVMVEVKKYSVSTKPDHLISRDSPIIPLTIIQ